MTIRFSDEQEKEAQKKAKHAGVEVSTYVRYAALKYRPTKNEVLNLKNKI